MSTPSGMSFKIVCGAAGLAAVFGLAMLLWLAFPANSLVLPPPAAVWAQMQDPGLLQAAFQFIALLVPAFLKATVYGLTAGVAASLSQTLALIVYPVLRVWRQLPFIALIPLFFIWFGLGVSQHDALPVLAMSLVIAVRTAETFSPAISKDAVRSSNVGWPPDFQELLKRAPQQIFPGLRDAFRLGASLIVAAQLLGSSSGIGYLLTMSMQVFDIAKAVAAFLIIWAIFIAAEILLSGIEFFFRSRQAG
jgi:ABC-type nitrate/sulfonate/bicarbonate transport system permease component